MGGGKKLDKFSGKIEFKNVSFHYPTRPDVKASIFIIVSNNNNNIYRICAFLLLLFTKSYLKYHLGQRAIVIDRNLFLIKPKMINKLIDNVQSKFCFF